MVSPVIPVSSVQGTGSPSLKENREIGSSIRQWLSKGTEWVSQSLGAKLQRVVSFGKSVPADPIRAAFEQNSLRRIRNDEKEKLIASLKALDPVSIPPTALASFKQGLWTDEIFSHNDWPLFVLHFYIQGDLDIMELSKLFIFDECRGLDRFQAHDLSNPEDLALLGQSLELLELGDKFSELTKIDPKHHQFFSFRFPINEHMNDAFNTVRIEGVPYFLIIEPEKNEMQVIIAPPYLEYEINKLKNGRNATFPDAVLGYDPSDRMEDPKTRVMCLPCRYVSLPKCIHQTVQTKGLGIYHHDMIHLVLDSQIRHREIWSNLAKEFKNGRLGDLLGDRNVIYTENDLVVGLGKKFEPQDVFWFNLFYLTRDKEERFALLSHVFNQEVSLMQKYNLTFASLEKFCREKGTTYERSTFDAFKMRRRSRASSPAIGLI